MAPSAFNSNAWPSELPKLAKEKLAMSFKAFRARKDRKGGKN